MSSIDDLAEQESVHILNANKSFQEVCLHVVLGNMHDQTDLFEITYYSSLLLECSVFLDLCMQTGRDSDLLQCGHLVDEMLQFNRLICCSLAELRTLQEQG